MSKSKTTTEEKAKRHHKRKYQFETYVFKLLKTIHPDSRISAKCTYQLNEIMVLLATKISECAHQFVALQNYQTVTSREIQSAVRTILPEQLQKHAISKGTVAVTRYNADVVEADNHPVNQEVPKKKSFGGGKNHKKPERAEHKAGIIFPGARCKRLIKSITKCRVGMGAPVYLAAVLEYICAEILELSGNAARDTKKSTIKTRHLFLVAANDQELTALFNKYNIEFNGGGVIPRIRDELIPRDDKPKKKAKASSKASYKDANSAEGKKHRFRPGTVALREIRKQQKLTELNIQKAPFERIVREISKKIEFSDDVRFSDGVIECLQGFVESSLVHIYNDALDAAIYTGREGVNGKDVKFALSHSSMGFNKFEIPDALQKTRQNIVSPNQISKEPLQRLARKAGIKRCSADFYEISRLIIDGIIHDVLLQAHTITYHLRMKTINTKAIKSAMGMLGFNYI